MALPQLGKTAAIAAGATTAGAGGIAGIGYGGWSIYDAANPTGRRQLEGQNLRFSPWTADMKVTQSLEDVTKRDLKFESRHCFKSFYGNVQVTHMDLTSTLGRGKVENDTLKPWEPVEKQTEPAKGCFLMHFYYKDATTMTMQTEFTAKSGKYGWALWSGVKHFVNVRTGHNQNTNTPTLTFLYELLFLERKDDNTWKVKGGYYVEDNEPLTNLYKFDTKLSFRLPHQNKPFQIEAKNDSQFRSYGLWEEDAKGTQEVLDGFDLQLGYKVELGAPKNKELKRLRIPGRKFLEIKQPTTVCDRDNEAHFCSDEKYKVDNDTWIKFTNSSPDKNISETLVKMYAPFRGKRGVWKDIKGLCEGRSSTRNPEEEDINFLKRYCFVDGDGNYPGA